MIGITGDIAGGGALHLAGSVREAVPYGFALAVFVPAAFDLIGSGGGAPDKFFGKLEWSKTHLGLGKISSEAVAGRQQRKKCGNTKRAGVEIPAMATSSSAHGLPLEPTL